MLLVSGTARKEGLDNTFASHVYCYRVTHLGGFSEGTIAAVVASFTT